MRTVGLNMTLLSAELVGGGRVYRLASETEAYLDGLLFLACKSAQSPVHEACKLRARTTRRTIIAGRFAES